MKLKPVPEGVGAGLGRANAQSAAPWGKGHAAPQLTMTE